MNSLELVDAFKTANMIVEWAIVAIPSLFGLGAIGSLGYGVFSSARGWIHHGGDMLKLGASIIAGGFAGGIGGIRAVGSLRAMGQDISIGEAMKMVGGEALKGGVKASTGSRGWLQVANRSLWGNEAERSFLSKKPVERTVIKKADGSKEVRERIEGDKIGATEKVLKEKVIDEGPRGPGGGGKPPSRPPAGGGRRPPSHPSGAQSSASELGLEVVRDPKVIRDVEGSRNNSST